MNNDNENINLTGESGCMLLIIVGFAFALAVPFILIESINYIFGFKVIEYSTKNYLIIGLSTGFMVITILFSKIILEQLKTKRDEKNNKYSK